MANAEKWQEIQRLEDFAEGKHWKRQRCRWPTKKTKTLGNAAFEGFLCRRVLENAVLRELAPQSWSTLPDFKALGLGDVPF